MANTHNVLVGQSGGPTAAINSSLAGVFDTARSMGAGVLGMRYGVEGLFKDKLLDLERSLRNEVDVQLLRQTPSSYLGSCRYKLPLPEENEEPYELLFDLFARNRIGAVLYIGGNDSMDTISKLSAYGAREGSGIRFIGVPKTIDNDLEGTDHTPGYGSAAKFIATSVAEIGRDSSVYDLRNVTFVEIMGRNTGWLAGSSVLASQEFAVCPDLILLPESPVTEDALTERIAELLGQMKSVVVAVSEGARRPDGSLMAQPPTSAIKTDAFGHEAALSGASRYLAATIGERLGVKTRAVEFSTLQRCANHLASGTDLDEAYALGGLAVRAAFEGATGVIPAIRRLSDQPYRTEYVTVNIADVANRERKVPYDWIREDGMGVTDDFVRYARPLVQGEVTPLFVGGLPHHIQMLTWGR
ncbi:MAG: 6-phosphofructokinase [Atopobiaceae bacterium]|nr:6-phosphofructokinase [Atopobiaceae bacterium]